MINSGAINTYAINGLPANPPSVIVQEDVLETAVITNTSPLWDVYIIESAVVRNPVPQTSGFTLAIDDDPAVITSIIYAPIVTAHQDVLEAAILNDLHDIIRTARIDVRDPASIFSEYEYHVTARQDALDPDPALIVSYITAAHPTAYLLDTAVITSLASYVATVRVDVLETMVGNDRAYPASPEFARDPTPAVITSLNLIGLRTTRTDARDPTPALITSAVNLAGDDRRVDVLETAVITSLASYTYTAVEVVHEQAFLESWIYNTGGVDEDSGWGLDDAWTCETGAWAMSRYTGVGITDLGSRFAVSGGGLFERSGAFANARLETGSSDLGSKMKKRATNLYIQGSYDSSLTVHVTAEVNGTQGTYTYAPLTDITGKPTTVRTDIGRKINSCYYKFGIESVGRAEFFGCDALVHATQRRI